MNETLRELHSLASLFLEPKEAAEINSLIKLKAWNSLRILVGDISEKYEVRLLLKEENQTKLEEWMMLEKMNDIAIDLAIQMQNEVDEENKSSGKKRRRRIIRHQPSSGEKAVV